MKQTMYIDIIKFLFNFHVAVLQIVYIIQQFLDMYM